MRVYVATKFEAKDRARRVMRALEDAGHEITHDWTREEDGDGEDFLRACALADLAGVLSSDALVLLVEPGMRGAFVELGAALARGVRVVVSGETPCIFASLADARVPNDDEVAGALDISACASCGVLIAGGPTRCLPCAARGGDQ